MASFKNLEVQKIVENQNEGQRFLWFTFLDNAREPFHNLCALLSRGKGFCAPASILQRKKAGIYIYVYLYIYTHVHITIYKHIYVYIQPDNCSPHLLELS
jgi:hypothetical protein